jgi:hypothetical protein
MIILNRLPEMCVVAAVKCAVDNLDYRRNSIAHHRTDHDEGQTTTGMANGQDEGALTKGKPKGQRQLHNDQRQPA